MEELPDPGAVRYALQKPARVKEGIRYVWYWLKNRPLPPMKVRRNTSYRYRRSMVEPSELYLGNQSCGSKHLYGPDWCTVPITDSPVYKLLNDDYEKVSTIIGLDDCYCENGHSSLEECSEHLKKVVNSSVERGQERPVEYFTRPDGKKIISHGHIDATLAHYNGSQVKAVEIPMKIYLWENVTISDAFYGVRHVPIPYVSVFYENEEIIIGRRRDVYERIDLMDKEDIVNKRVIDFGSNIGSMTFAAVFRGATNALGIEYDEDLVTSAIRSNVAFNQECDFEQGDLSKKLRLDEEYDTGFCFAIHNHVENTEMLAKNIQNNVKNVLYFETHPDRKFPEEIEDMVKDKEFRGITGTNYKREFYKLTLY